ncbi:hypothetical protein QFZ82_006637 [Streptomyces sp. V4I23]|uniref:phenylacetaldoxime dehydratase family protein n=1 Tax=Streptomyces sp. V4I23 TaxID=3042282 RepID=UPI0027847010|nr:phenylacetaldoxime dehydratase family protein [Streptomyces sp. V4I23]MDQ1012152.1 hypothetical protein [Streptomyces sp. V4I23]
MTWSRAHRTHLEIYGAFFKKMLGKDGEPLDISFWHEVSAIPAGDATVEYINCHKRTGFLTILDHQEELTVHEHQPYTRFGRRRL